MHRVCVCVCLLDTWFVHSTWREQCITFFIVSCTHVLRVSVISLVRIFYTGHCWCVTVAFHKMQPIDINLSVCVCHLWHHLFLVSCWDASRTPFICLRENNPTTHGLLVLHSLPSCSCSCSVLLLLLVSCDHLMTHTHTWYASDSVDLSRQWEREREELMQSTRKVIIQLHWE